METGKTLEQIMALVKRREVMISDHGYDELAEDAISVKDNYIKCRQRNSR